MDTSLRWMGWSPQMRCVGVSVRREGASSRAQATARNEPDGGPGGPWTVLGLLGAADEDRGRGAAREGLQRVPAGPIGGRITGLPPYRPLGARLTHTWHGPISPSGHPLSIRRFYAVSRRA